MSACNWICWVIGVGTGALAFWASVDAVTVLPAVLIALAVGAFVALVLSDLVCGNAADQAEAVAATGVQVEAEAAEKTMARKIETAELVAEAEKMQALGDDYDDGGGLVDVGKGKMPEMLDGPQGGEADDLKAIKGVGPKLEALLNHLGVYHFGQIARWSAEEIAWVDANLEGFKGRVSRDDWVSQAKVLAAGGDTEFSARVGKGGVY